MKKLFIVEKSNHKKSEHDERISEWGLGSFFVCDLFVSFPISLRILIVRPSSTQSLSADYSSDFDTSFATRYLLIPLLIYIPVPILGDSLHDHSESTNHTLPDLTLPIFRSFESVGVRLEIHHRLVDFFLGVEDEGAILDDFLIEG